MAKKRANGDGNIRKRKDGRWEGRYVVGRDPDTGKMITKEEILELRNRMESVRCNYKARSDEETKQENIRQSSRRNSEKP